MQLDLPVPDNVISYARDHLIEGESSNDYQEYFKYLTNARHLGEARDWRQALNNYHQPMNAAHQADDA